MTLFKKILKTACVITLAGLIGTGTYFNKEIVGGTNTTKILNPQGEVIEIEIPVYSLFDVGPNRCSLYSRKVTEFFGNTITRGNSWDLPNRNPSSEYSEDSLQKGRIVLFYKEGHEYNKKGRKGTHTACYLGQRPEGEHVFAEQRGIDTKISTLEELSKGGYEPVQIIYPSKK